MSPEGHWNTRLGPGTRADDGHWFDCGWQPSPARCCPPAATKVPASPLIVEVLAAVLTGASFSFDASSFANNDVRIELAAMCAQPGVRLPGERRVAAREAAKEHGVVVERSLYERVVRLGAVR